MPIVFEKSAKAQAFEKGLFLLVAIIVGAVFGSPFFMDIHLGLMWKIIIGVTIGISILLFIKLIREIIEILKTGESFRVTITEQELSWFSPVPKLMESFTLKLSDIRAVHRLITRYRNSKRSNKVEFKIETAKGEMFELKPQMCGINPHKVFKALEGKNIPYHVNTTTEGPKLKIGNGDVSIGINSNGKSKIKSPLS